MSGALQQFNESLELANSLKKIERDKYRPNPNIHQQPFVKGLRGGAIVLMVAAFEFFIRKLFEENISKLNPTPQIIDFDKLPDAMKIKAVFHGMERAIGGPLFEPKKPKIDRIKNILDASKLLFLGQLNPETFSETGSNPNSSLVKEKFKDVGIKDIFSDIKGAFEAKWNQTVAHDFISAKLDEIVRTRHIVAHTADTLNISRKTQNEYFKFLKILTKILDKELEKQINNLLITAKK